MSADQTLLALQERLLQRRQVRQERPALPGRVLPVRQAQRVLQPQEPVKALQREPARGPVWD